MDNTILIGREYEHRLFQRVLGYFDAPAFVRRARSVQEALDQLLAACCRQRDQWLLMPRIRLGVLRGLAGDWHRLLPWLANQEQVMVLEKLQAELTPRLRTRIEPTSSGRQLQRALQALRESLEHFNGRWQAFLPTVDLTAVNQARDGYNRYYLLEKECAMRSARLARQGFKRLEPLTRSELEDLIPLLPIPMLKQ